MSWIDIGVNLGHRRFARDREAVIARAREAGVEAMVLTGTSVAESERAAELARAFGEVATAATAFICPLRFLMFLRALRF